MEIKKRKRLTDSRFLSFIIENEVYCIDILKVKEILGITIISPVPQTPDYIKGVINLRGQIIPIIDLRLKFGMELKEYTKRTSIIVIEISYDDELTHMCVIVDSIQEVICIPEDTISKVSYINGKIQTNFIKGIANTNTGIIIVLNVVEILNENEKKLIKSVEDTVELNQN